MGRLCSKRQGAGEGAAANRRCERARSRLTLYHTHTHTHTRMSGGEGASRTNNHVQIPATMHAGTHTASCKDRPGTTARRGTATWQTTWHPLLGLDVRGQTHRPLTNRRSPALYGVRNPATHPPTCQYCVPRIPRERHGSRLIIPVTRWKILECRLGERQDIGIQCKVHDVDVAIGIP